RFNPAKLLVDPYVRSLDRRFAFDPAMVGGGDDLATRDDTDSAPFVPKGIVTRYVKPAAARRPRVPWASTVVYELNVRGFTQGHPHEAKALRRTLVGTAHTATLSHMS